MVIVQEVLIAENSEAFSAELCAQFQKHYKATLCRDGLQALHILKTHRPEILILDLMLPKLDGITLLNKLKSERPPVILAVTTMTNSYIEQAVRELGASYLMLKPCSAGAVLRRTEDIIRRQKIPEIPDSQMLTARILEELHFSAKLDGFHQLKIGIPLYAQDHHVSLSKEFYPAVASLSGADDWRQVERSIRTAVKAAWNQGTDPVWLTYFPENQDACPTNKVFLTRISQILNIRCREYLDTASVSRTREA